MRRPRKLLAATFVGLAALAGAAAPAAADDEQAGPARVVSPAGDEQGEQQDPRESGTSPYVALGDSYSSAAGVLPFVAGSPPACSRSQLNYAHDIAQLTQPTSFTDVTCSGARTEDFFRAQPVTPPDPRVRPQLDAVTGATRLVTMTIGGNDEGVFVNSFFGCIGVTARTGDVFGNPCQRAYGDTFVDLIRQKTYPNLVRALTAVRRKAPDATVAILGYPEILPRRGSIACFPVMPVSLGDVPWLHHQQDVLNGAVRRAAAQTGARFVDMAPSSAAHNACTPPAQRWIEPAVGPVNAYPVHPNAAGEAAMADQAVRQLGLGRDPSDG